MPDTATPRDLARSLASRALNAAIRGEWAIAGAIVRRLNADCGSEGAMTAVVAWCDTLIARRGLDGGDGMRIMFAPRPGQGTQPRPRIQWASQLIAARARRDEATFGKLIDGLPANPKLVGDCVGAVLECVALTLKEDEDAT